MSKLKNLVDRLKFELEGDFRRHEADGISRLILNLLDSFLYQMLPEETPENKEVLDEIRKNIGEDIRHYKCRFCNNPAEHWHGSCQLCEFHYKDTETQKIIKQADSNLKDYKLK